MLMSSMMGAIAFQKGLGLVHSTAHALGTVADLHHGLANAVMIDHALAFNVETVPDRFGVMAQTVGLDDESPDGFLRWLADLKAEIGMPRSLVDTAVEPDDLERLVRRGHRGHLPPQQPPTGDPRRLRAHLRRGVRVTAERRRPLRIGLSACFFHADPTRPVFKGKTLLYAEESMLDLLGRCGAPGLPRCPRPTPAGPRPRATTSTTSTAWCSQGGSDVCPRSYGEEPLRPEWEGDEPRDRYEIELIHAFHDAGKPVLGICRGVADPQRGLRRHALPGHHHPARPGRSSTATGRSTTPTATRWTWSPARHLAALYGGRDRRVVTVNSVHHQAVKDLAAGFVVEAVSATDGIVEAMRRPGRRTFAGRRAVAPGVHPGRRRPSSSRPTRWSTDFLAAACAGGRGSGPGRRGRS